MGTSVGKVGILEGLSVGKLLGCVEGVLVGEFVGCVGVQLGTAVGMVVG